jgi:hypothetical protein
VAAPQAASWNLSSERLSGTDELPLKNVKRICPTLACTTPATLRSTHTLIIIYLPRSDTLSEVLMAAAKPLYMSEPFFPFFDGNLFSLDITCVCSSLVVVIVGFLRKLF